MFILPSMIGLRAKFSAVLVADATPIRRATMTDIAGGTSITKTMPTYVAGDLLVAFLVSYQSGTLNTVPIDAPAGWTKLGEWNWNYNDTHAIYYKWATSNGGGEASPTWVCGTNNFHELNISSFYGVDPSNPFDVNEFHNRNQNTTRTVDALTTTSDNALLCLTSSGYSNAITSTPAGMTQVALWDDNTVGFYTQEQLNKGDSGQRTHTQAGLDYYHTKMIAIRPKQKVASPPPNMEANGDTKYYSASGTSYNVPDITVPSGLSNSALIVFVGLNADSATDVTAATWNGIAMTNLLKVGMVTQKNLTAFVLPAPTAGNNTLALTFSGGSIARDIIIGWGVLSGVHQTAPIYTSAGDSVSTGSIAVAPIATTNNYPLAFISAYANSITPNAGQTILSAETTGSLVSQLATEAPVIGAQSLGWTFTNLYTVDAIGLTIKPV